MQMVGPLAGSRRTRSQGQQNKALSGIELGCIGVAILGAASGFLFRRNHKAAIRQNRILQEQQKEVHARMTALQSSLDGHAKDSQMAASAAKALAEELHQQMSDKSLLHATSIQELDVQLNEAVAAKEVDNGPWLFCIPPAISKSWIPTSS